MIMITMILIIRMIAIITTINDITVRIIAMIRIPIIYNKNNNKDDTHNIDNDNDNMWTYISRYINIDVHDNNLV